MGNIKRYFIYSSTGSSHICKTCANTIKFIFSETENKMINSLKRFREIIICVSCLFMSGCTSSDQQVLRENDTIIFLGDSITAAGVKPNGYITLLSKSIANAYPNLDIKIIGAGIGGNKVPDCQERLDRDVLQKKPTIVVIYIGINDVWHWNVNNGTPIEDFEAGLKDMIAKINSTGARVILCTPTVIGEKVDGTNTYDKMLDEYSDVSRNVAKETGSQLLDLRKAFINYLKKHNPDNVEKGILTSDTVHLNNKGNSVLAGLMLAALNVPQTN